MAKREDKPRRKGFFSDLRLPVARKYIFPYSRSRALVVGCLGGLLLVALFSYNIVLQQGTLISNGPLSSNHAAFGTDCAACHTPLSDVSDDKCAACHEKYGDELGVYSFDAHYLYRSDDFSRLVFQPNQGHCFTCHTEHVGQQAPITRVPDEQCVVCHAFGSFNDRHPEFDFATDTDPDPANLRFTHTHHVNEIAKREELLDIEQTCLYCHNPEPDGKQFQPLAFDRHCDACHLTIEVATDWLPVAPSSGSSTPGVLSLASFQGEQPLGSQWAFYTNPNEFQERGGRIRKTPIYHQDDWVLENLKRLRSLLYPAQELPDLLAASADVPPEEARRLYTEAVSTLRTYANSLRSRPEREVQQDLTTTEQLLQQIERQLQDPYRPIDETRFLISGAELDTSLTPDQVDAYREVIQNLTKPCRQCHLVEQATIMRAQNDQRTLQRAEFDHRAHIIQQRCLDCHAVIPIREHFATKTRADSTRDHAGIENLPRLQSCQTCHAGGKASNTCITCHQFHPNSDHRSNLLLYID